MIQFSRLRLSGFKSFVDRTELEIAPGLNGVVGPNGCGKSNLVEALRWVMGESSAKRMRGDGMEDVIFSGTAKRPGRNVAEVSLLLNNEKRTAPAAYNGSDEIEITRRIEKDHGSNYKINGKNVRARDVQMLFADTVTGANSPALVTQGKVTQIINAKPLDRRMILEESAGISGLYARRHEAEIRLKAADANLLRLQDVMGGMEGRLSSLKSQARQASKYRNIVAQIRQFELLIAALEWRGLEERLSACGRTLEEAESGVREKLIAVTQLTKTQTAQAQDLPALRQAEAESAARLQTRRLALQRLEDEVARLEESRRDLQSQAGQTHTDAEHEKHTLSESAGNLERLEAEHGSLIQKQEGDGGRLEEKQAARAALETKVTALEKQFTGLMQSMAEARARRQSLEQSIAQNSARIETVTARRDRAREDLSLLESGNNNQGDSKKLEGKISGLEGDLQKLNEDLESTVKGREDLRALIDSARESLKNSARAVAELNAQIATLESFLQADKGGKFTAVLNSVKAQSGFEKALSRALGDTLMASLEESAPARWTKRAPIENLPELPDSIPSITGYVKYPPELHLALSQIGFIEDPARGDSLAQKLRPGQALVSADGSYWRWDGYGQKAEAADRNALHLEHKNRLESLKAGQPAAQKAQEKAQADLDALQGQETAMEASSKSIQVRLKETDQALRQARAELASLQQQETRFESEQKRLEDILALAAEDIRTLEEVIGWDKERLKAAGDSESEQKAEALEKIRASLAESREMHQKAVRAFDQQMQEQNARKARLHAIADERINLQNRAIRSKERLRHLEERSAALAARLKEISAQPKDFEEGRQTILEEISACERDRSAAAESLAACENEVGETTKALKEAEAALSQSREARAHAQATLDLIRERQDKLRTDITGQFGMQPAELSVHVAIDPARPPEDLEEISRKKDKLLRQRDDIGPVNLRAEDEAQALEKDVGTLLHERNDLMEAIAELRGGIRKINEEAAERLVSAFRHVDSHFQALFTRLFGGGQAYLKLLDSDDPLETGLEIYAQPPGKSLQSLSLLSGGEQTLASIALIFA
ncbi:MAG: chromosome segregation protein SMC, partial [Alphaproteobacteria bacterium]|nr:chromosome segregation protein SMC [Alphaproteobacteria bacterium]